MKSILPFIFCLLAFNSFAQINFSGLNWLGDTADYILSADKELILQSEKTASKNTVNLYVAHNNLNKVTQWNIELTIGCNTSASNMVKIHLASTDSTLNNSLNIAIGNTNDCVNLCMGNKAIIEGTPKILDAKSSEIKIAVSRSVVDSDTIEYLLSTEILTEGATEVIREQNVAKIAVNEHTTQKYMGITNIFSKTYAQGKYLINKFVTTIGEEEIISEKDPKTDDESIFFRGCIVISEIMANPNSELGLPNQEYVELYNAADTTITLTNWTISNGKQIGSIAECSLKAGEYIIVCGKTHLTDFNGIRATTLSAWPTLGNASGQIVLRNQHGRVADFVDYSDKMFGNTFKKDGGWSLERIDNLNISNDPSNWAPSEATQGGTPAQPNSIGGKYADVICPAIKKIIANPTGDTLNIFFSEPIDTTFFEHTFYLNNQKTNFDIVWADDVTLAHFIVRTDNIIQRHKVYEIDNFSVVDYANNQPINNKVRTAIAEKISAKSIIINEIMANATPTNADYLEIFNPTDDAYNLSDLCFGLIRNDELTSCSRITTDQQLIFPNDYIVVCSDSTLVAQMFSVANPQWIISNSKFPNLPTEGEIAICLIRGEIVDKVPYSDKWHSQFIADLHNVSLERILTEANSDTPTNWTSAAATSGYATPTQQNSQHRDKLATTSHNIEQKVKRFTPNGDGIDDSMVVATNFADGQWIATMKIYAANGLLVATPYNNTPMAVTGELIWTGQADDGSTLLPGTYIVTLSAWQTKGKKYNWKGTCTIGVADND